MFLYIILSIYYVLCILIELGLKNKNKKINENFWIFILLFPLFFLAAFRSVNVGNDTYNYFRSFNLISQESLFSSTVSRLEIGYVFLVKFLSKLGLNYLGFQVVVNLFIYYVFGITIKKYSKFYSVSAFVFFNMNMFFQTMNISRAYLAISFLLLSIKYIIDRNFIKFLIFVLIATLFHTSAIVFLIIYPFTYLKWTYKKFLIFIFISISVSLFFNQIIELFIQITGRYESYLSSKYFQFEDNIARYFYLLFQLVFFIIGLFSRYYKLNILTIANKSNNVIDSIKKLNINEQSIKINLWFSSTAITLLIAIAGLKATIMSRIGIYFSTLYIIYIPEIINHIKTLKIGKLLTFVILTLLLFYFYIIMIYRPNWIGVIPYEFYWNN